MDNILKQLDYKDIFKYFSEISKIPRGSGNEKEISDYLVEFAKKNNLEHTQDSANNVIMIKEASAGYEKCPAIILQGHMDMVCEKKNEFIHDFTKDEIKLIVDGDYLRADGTTLGADNGIAVAYIMAILTDETLQHPRLEAIITTDEEVGMLGAKALDTSSLRGKFMINLDSEEEGYLLASCAGGLTGTSTLPITRVSEQGRKLKISIGGLKGGHSGQEIGNNRTNAVKLISRLAFDLNDKASFGLIQLQGGYKDNVIPREAIMELCVNPSEMKELEETITTQMKIYQIELASSEPDLNFTIEDLGEGSYDVLHPVSFEKLLFLLTNLPYGVQAMSSDIEGLVESSLNLGITYLDEDAAIICNSVRSSKSSYKHHINDKLNYLVEFLGGEYVMRNEYPAWEFKKDSIFREHVKSIYKEMNGKDMVVEAIHAGLECGLINEKMPGLDIISIGPDMSGIHTIEEKLDIESTKRVYKFVERIIQEKIEE